MVTVYLIRHGETDANRNQIIQGQLDTQLNETGLWQSRLVAQALSSAKFELAYSSDLSRATSTASAILQHHPDVVLYKHEGLRERFMGELQGHKIGHAKPLKTDPGIESGPTFNARAMDWWTTEIVERIASRSPEKESGSILVVSHGGFIATLVRNLVQKKKLYPNKGVVMTKCPNTSIAVIEWTGTEGVLMDYGNASHLTQAQGAGFRAIPDA